VRGAARLRDRQVLAAQIAALSVDVARSRDREDVSTDFQRGALDALLWITDGGPAPLTGVLAVLPVPLETIVGELAAAEDIIYGRPSRHRNHALGVEHALMWAQFANATPPVPQPPPSAGPAGRLSTPNSRQGRPR
jgi:hypothetical protein